MFWKRERKSKREVVWRTSEILQFRHTKCGVLSARRTRIGSVSSLHIYWNTPDCIMSRLVLSQLEFVNRHIDPCCLEWPFKSSFQSSRKIKWFTTSGSLWPSCCFPHNSTNYDQFCQGSHQYIPAYTCHYCRMDNPHRRYLSPGLSLAKLYFLYHEHCVKECLTPASEWVYRTTFNAEYNLTFGRWEYAHTHILHSQECLSIQIHTHTRTHTHMHTHTQILYQTKIDACKSCDKFKVKMVLKKTLLHPNSWN